MMGQTGVLGKESEMIEIVDTTAERERELLEWLLHVSFECKCTGMSRHDIHFVCHGCQKELLVREVQKLRAELAKLKGE